MTHFADRLVAAIRRTENPTVMGLDTRLSHMPPSMKEAFLDQASDPVQATGAALAHFNRRLIDATADLIPAVKLQSACYEAYGLAGLAALQETINHAQEKGLLVILDGKRNDIGSSADGYAQAYLGTSAWLDDQQRPVFGADALTVNGYLGFDGIQPFTARFSPRGNGIFVLVRTSNPSAGSFQDLVLADGRAVCDAMADLVQQWGQEHIGTCGYSAIGAVVGATWPRQAEALRRRMPQTIFLIPGYGAQGATAADAVAGFGPDGYGGLVNASRSVLTAWQKHQMDHELYDLAARKELMQMKEALNQALTDRAMQQGGG